MTDPKVKLVISAVDQSRAAFDSLRKNLSGANSLVGELKAAFAGLSAAFLAQRLGSEVIQYNKTLETSRLGIAAIFTSMTDIADAEGNALAGMEKFRASQGLAVLAQQELQKVAMTTAATFQELVEVYQGILAPALSAKMTFAETLELTGLLTNAVKSIGLPINQIKQEARDLVQGGINAASSSLATALGITDAMVKKWREGGTVFTELKDRLEGFSYASNEFANTWEGALSNFKDIGQRALGEGFKPVFDFLKQELINLTEQIAVVTRDEKGIPIKIDIKPEAKAQIKEIARAIIDLMGVIKDVTAVVVDFGKEFGAALVILWTAKKAWEISAAFTAVASSLKLVAAGATAANAALIKGPLGLLLFTGTLMGAHMVQEHFAAKRLAAYGKDVDAELSKMGVAAEITAEKFEPLLRFFPELSNNARATADLIAKGVIKQDELGFLTIPSKDEIDAYFAEYNKRMAEEAKRLKVTPKPQPLSGEKKIEAEKAGKDWKGLSRDLQADIEKASAGTDEWADKLLDIDNKYADLIVKAREMAAKGAPVDTGLLENWRIAMRANVDWEKQWKAYEEGLKRREEAEKTYGDVVKAVNEELRSDLENRVQDAIDEETGLTKRLGDVWFSGAITYQQYQDDLVRIEEAGAKKRRKIVEDAEKTRRESELQTLIAITELAEKEGGISKEESVRRQVAYTEELLVIQERYLRTIDRLKDPTGWNAQQRAIIDTQQRLVDLRNTLQIYTGGFGEGMALGISDTLNQLQTTFQAGKSLAEDTAKAMQGAFQEFFFDAFQGELKTASDYLASFAKAVEKTIADILSQQMTKGILTGLKGLFPRPAMPTLGAGLEDERDAYFAGQQTTGTDTVSQAAASASEAAAAIAEQAAASASVTVAVTTQIPQQASLTAEMTAQIPVIAALTEAYYALAAAMQAASAGGGIGGGFAGINGGWGGITDAAVISGPAFHSGGTVSPSTPPLTIDFSPILAGLPRFHGGGKLSADERLIIAQTGERILSREQTNVVERLAASGTGMRPPNIQITVNNRSGAPMDNGTVEDVRFDGRQWVVKVLIDALNADPSLRRKLNAPGGAW